MRGIVRITGKTVGVTALVGFAVAIALLLIYSYSTRKQVKTSVLARGLHWEILEPKPTDHLFVARVRDFSHLGMSGELKLYFFRDRLMRIMFKPQDPAAYWTRLVASERLIVEAQPGLPIWMAKNKSPVDIWLNLHPPGPLDGQFIGWRDDRLEREVSYRYD
jgi:hypothetical protein